MQTSARELWQEASQDERAILCPVCGCSSFRIVLTPEDVGKQRVWLKEFHRERSRVEKDHSDFTLDDTTNIVACEHCGTVLRNPQPTPEAVAKRYGEDEYGSEALEQFLANQIDFFRQKARR